jgi:hypothetical protein
MLYNDARLTRIDVCSSIRAGLMNLQPRTCKAPCPMLISAVTSRSLDMATRKSLHSSISFVVNAPHVCVTSAVYVHAYQSRMTRFQRPCKFKIQTTKRIRPLSKNKNMRSQYSIHKVQTRTISSPFLSLFLLSFHL